MCVLPLLCLSSVYEGVESSWDPPRSTPDYIYRLMHDLSLNGLFRLESFRAAVLTDTWGEVNRQIAVLADECFYYSVSNPSLGRRSGRRTFRLIPVRLVEDGLLQFLGRNRMSIVNDILSDAFLWGQVDVISDGSMDSGCAMSSVDWGVMILMANTYNIAWSLNNRLASYSGVETYNASDMEYDSDDTMSLPSLLSVEDFGKWILIICFG